MQNENHDADAVTKKNDQSKQQKSLFLRLEQITEGGQCQKRRQYIDGKNGENYQICCRRSEEIFVIGLYMCKKRKN